MQQQSGRGLGYCAAAHHPPTRRRRGIRLGRRETLRRGVAVVREELIKILRRHLQKLWLQLQRPRQHQDTTCNTWLAHISTMASTDVADPRIV